MSKLYRTSSIFRSHPQPTEYGNVRLAVQLDLHTMGNCRPKLFFLNNSPTRTHTPIQTYTNTHEAKESPDRPPARRQRDNPQVVFAERLWQMGVRLITLNLLPYFAWKMFAAARCAHVPVTDVCTAFHPATICE